MKRWALVSGGYAFLVVERADKPDAGADWREVSAAEQVGDRIVNGEFVRPGLAPSDVRAKCLEALSASDARVTRALEDGSTVPEELKEYREAIRQIYRSGSAPSTWPAPPEYNPRVKP